MLFSPSPRAVLPAGFGASTFYASGRKLTSKRQARLVRPSLWIRFWLLVLEFKQLIMWNYQHHLFDVVVLFLGATSSESLSSLLILRTDRPLG
jgi:hypothetical protein